MIGKLKGIVDEIDSDHVIIDVNGIGYVVFTTQRLLSQLPSVGEAVTLYIETQMREDAIRLFGFLNQYDKGWFRLLQNVQGVGAKVALAILGTLSTNELSSAIALRDLATLCRAPGVGKKVAERLVTELKNKIPAFTGDASSIGLKQELGGGVATQPILDAVSALTNLGYSREQAASAVAVAVKESGEEANSAKLIRLGLKQLSR